MESAALIGRENVGKLLKSRTVRLAYQRLDEGLSATKVKPFVSQGAVIYSAPMTDYTERREASKTVLQVAGHLVPEPQDLGAQVLVVINGLDLARAYGSEQLPAEVSTCEQPTGDAAESRLKAPEPKAVVEARDSTSLPGHVR